MASCDLFVSLTGVGWVVEFLLVVEVWSGFGEGWRKVWACSGGWSV